MELAKAVRGWRWWRTIAVGTTRQGKTVVAGGPSNLVPAQVAAAQELGLINIPGNPGWHAEGWLIYGAGEMGYQIVRAVTTTNICKGCILVIIEEAGGGGTVTGKRTFQFPIPPN
jgi:hypothetical protein